MFQSVRFAATIAARLGAVRAMSYKAATEPWFNFEGKTAVVTGAGKGETHPLSLARGSAGDCDFVSLPALARVCGPLCACVTRELPFVLWRLDELPNQRDIGHGWHKFAVEQLYQ